MAAPARLSLKHEYGRVTHVSQALRALAQDVGVLIVACSQLKRPDRDRALFRPGLDDLRASGAIEQNRDAVLLIYHDRPGSAELGLATYRSGPTGAIPVRWAGSRVRFEDPDPDVLAE